MFVNPRKVWILPTEKFVWTIQGLRFADIRYGTNPCPVTSRDEANLRVTGDADGFTGLVCHNARR